ncbi:polyprenyl synthetase family protein [Blattabacterium cuenoti]|uniref:polyprenyl synthetase family protein n=1 Tax=Blattabacterium cuenoti TaxID=1653831 RepID=UPI00163C22C4|nr:polyprenyl synthetase family protein [Blattabacterium cuenoti]
MNILDKIQVSIQEEMKYFEKQFFQITKNKISLIKNINNYIIPKKGKRIRPMFVFLIAKMLGNIQKKTYHTASLIELIHTATLVHDDVIDNSNFRRGFSSINAIWQNKIAVLIGDYFLSKGLLLATNHHYHDLLKIICTTVKNMSEGELLQIEKSQTLDITEKIYNQIICKKTAGLISASCEGGAISVNVSKRTSLNMKYFGKLSGIAFQIRDDLFDYDNINDKLIGKPVGIDLKDKKITLPLIYAIKKASKNDKIWILDSIKNFNNHTTNHKIIDYVKQSGGITYAIKQMIKYKNKALKILDNYPKGSTKDSLKSLVNFLVERNI